jgi:FkbM family methyltransferase
MRKRRLYLRKFTAAPFEWLARYFPGNAFLGRMVDRLSFVRSVYGPLLYNTPRDKTFELCLAGYNGFVAESVLGLNSDFVFLDIGANLGLFSLIAARNPHCRKIYALEPVPRIFRILEANIRRNRAVIVEARAVALVGFDETDVFLSFSPRHSGLSRVLAESPGAVRAKAISAEALDRLVCAEGRIVAKIDVEGGELQVIETLRRTALYDRVDTIIIEISETNLGAPKKAKLLTLLEDNGFRETGRRGAPEHYDAQYVRQVLKRSSIVAAAGDFG